MHAKNASFINNNTNTNTNIINTNQYHLISTSSQVVTGGHSNNIVYGAVNANGLTGETDTS